MLVKVHDGEVGDVGVVQLDGAIAAGHQQLVLVELRPGEIILGVVCVESFLGDVSFGSLSAILYASIRAPDLRPLDLYTLGPQSQAEQAPVPHDAVVCGGCDCDARVKVGRVLDGVGVEAGRPELQHRRLHDRGGGRQL